MTSATARAHALIRARLQLRAGNLFPPPLDEAFFVAPQSDPDVLALDEALSALEKVDERKSRVVELRFFAGLNLKETSAAIGISTDTATRDWKMAKVWLLREIKRGRCGERSS